MREKRRKKLGFICIISSNFYAQKGHEKSSFQNFFAVQPIRREIEKKREKKEKKEERRKRKDRGRKG